MKTFTFTLLLCYTVSTLAFTTETVTTDSGLMTESAAGTTDAGDPDPPTTEDVPATTESPPTTPNTNVTAEFNTFQCGANYNFLLNGTCYVVQNYHQKWDKANKACVENFGANASLVEITPSNVQDVLELMVLSRHGSIWTGLNLVYTGAQLQWADGPSQNTSGTIFDLISNFKPEIQGSCYELVIEHWTTPKLQAKDCKKKRKFVCQFPEPSV